MFPPLPPEYSPLEQNDEEYGIENPLRPRDDYTSRDIEQSRYKKIWFKYCIFFQVTYGALLCLSALLFILLIQAWSEPIKFPVYSPANVAVEYYRELTTFNGTFNFDSIYRGKPTPELDAAWERISQEMIAPVRLTLEQVKKIGKIGSPSQVKFREEDGGGYMASLEVNHQLHCLNMLRKYIHHEYYETFDPAFTDGSPEVFKTHLDHCVEILRQNLMCSADVTMITYEWVRGFSEPYPDFNTRHHCRNFEKILAWGLENAVHIPLRQVSRFGDEVDLHDAP